VAHGERLPARGAYGLVGSTEIAWVGRRADGLRRLDRHRLSEGRPARRSLGRALLESKQDYMAFLGQQGGAPGVEDEKTLLEFLLLAIPRPARRRGSRADRGRKRRAVRAAGLAGTVPGRPG